MAETVITIVVAIIGSGVLNTALTAYINYKQKQRDSKSGMAQGMRLILKDRLRYLCIKYIDQGWIYEDELEDIIALHKCYHDDLRGNGFLDLEMSRVKSLEIRGVGVR